MVLCCMVPQCKSKYKRGNKENLKFHSFPKDKKLSKEWRVKLRTRKKIKPTDRVCSLHFLDTDYTYSDFVTRLSLGDWIEYQHFLSKTLKKNSVPTQNIPKRSSKLRENKKKIAAAARQERLGNRRRMATDKALAQTTEKSELEPLAQADDHLINVESDVPEMTWPTLQDCEDQFHLEESDPSTEIPHLKMDPFDDTMMFGDKDEELSAMAKEAVMKDTEAELMEPVEPICGELETYVGNYTNTEAELMEPVEPNCGELEGYANTYSVVTTTEAELMEPAEPNCGELETYVGNYTNTEAELMEPPDPHCGELETYAVNTQSRIAATNSQSLEIQYQCDNSNTIGISSGDPSNLNSFQCSTCLTPFPTMSGVLFHALSGCIKKLPQQNGAESVAAEEAAVPENGGDSSNATKCQTKTYQCATCLASFPSLVEHLVESVDCYEKTCEPSVGRNRYRWPLFPPSMRLSKYDVTGLL